MKPNYRKIKFKKDVTEHFHLNFAFQVHSLFPELDWLMLNFKLKKISEMYSVEIHSFVMLSTHSHILFKATQKNENYFAEELLKEINVSSRESLVEPIKEMAQYLNTYKYIYRNPVEAGIVKKCEDYSFSSLHGLLGKNELVSPVIDPLSVAQNPIKILRWLNNYFEKKLFHFNSLEI